MDAAIVAEPVLYGAAFANDDIRLAGFQFAVSPREPLFDGNAEIVKNHIRFRPSAVLRQSRYYMS